MAGKKDVLAVIGWYWRDWRSSTARALMSPLARGIYRELLDAHYAFETCDLPDDDRQLAALAAIDLKTWGKVKAEILPWIPLNSDGRRQNARCRAEWEAGCAYREERRMSGQSGAAKRWQSHGSAIAKPSISDGTAIISPMAKNSSPSPSPSPSHTPPPPPRGVCAEKIQPHSDSPSDPSATLPPDDDPDAHFADHPDDALLAAWNAARRAKGYPPDPPSPAHRDAWTALLEATESDRELALAAIDGYLALADSFVTEAGHSIRVFPHRVASVIAQARDKIERKRRAVAMAKPSNEELDESDVLAPEEQKARLAELRRAVLNKGGVA